ncbi:MAG: hypothetical protein R3F02_02740 [Thiolinea sp.]
MKNYILTLVVLLSFIVILSYQVFAEDQQTSARGVLERLDMLETDNKILKGALSKSILISPEIKCSDLPGDWEEASVGKGRFLLGQGNGYSAGRLGGQSTVTLTTGHLPNHGHRVSTNNHTNVHDGLGGSGNNYGILSTFSDIPSKPNWQAVLPNMLEKTGGSQPHENMPPYVVVYFCQLNNG